MLYDAISSNCILINIMLLDTTALPASQLVFPLASPPAYISAASMPASTPTPAESQKRTKMLASVLSPS